MKFVSDIKRQILRQIVKISFLYALLFLCSCKKGPDIFKNYGKNITVKRSLDDFHSIRTGQKFKVFITQNKFLPKSVSITYGSNLIDKINTDIKDGTLYLHDNNKENWVRRLDVQPVCTVNIHDIDELVVDGAASVECLDTIFGELLKFEMNSVEHQYIKVWVNYFYGELTNTGNAEFEGLANIFNFSNENGSWYDAGKLVVQKAYLFHYTNRDLFISPSNTMEANSYGDGNIYYKTEPSFSFKKIEHGRGRVLKY